MIPGNTEVIIGHEKYFTTFDHSWASFKNKYPLSDDAFKEIESKLMADEFCNFMGLTIRIKE